MLRKRIVSMIVATMATVGVAGAVPLVTAAPASAAIIPGRCEYTSAEPLLEYGDSGIAVMQAQCELNWSMTGANLAVDGEFGPATLAATKRFQGCVGISQDGDIGPDTWRWLNYWAASSGYAC